MEGQKAYVNKIWDLKTYKLKTDLPGHTDEVYCVDFVADKIVSGGRDRTVKMYVPVIFTVTKRIYCFYRWKT
jgi:WD40 repeat protein